MITLSFSFVEETSTGDWIHTTMAVDFETDDPDQVCELADRWVSDEACRGFKNMIPGTLRIVRA